MLVIEFAILHTAVPIVVPLVPNSPDDLNINYITRYHVVSSRVFMS